LLHERAEAQACRIEAAGGELAVEVHGVVADQEHEHEVAAARLDRAEGGGELGGPERHEGLEGDLRGEGRGVAPGDPGGLPGPDVVVADDGPAPRTAFGAQPAQGGMDLPVGGLAGEEYARAAFTA